MVAFLLEHHQGRLPPWLAPVQVVQLPVGRDQDAAVEKLAESLRDRDVRALVGSEATLGARIKMAHQRRVPWIGVIGPAEAAAGHVTVTVLALPNSTERDGYGAGGHATRGHEACARAGYALPCRSGSCPVGGGEPYRSGAGRRSWVRCGSDHVRKIRP